MNYKFKDFLYEQFKERYKHFIICSLPMTGKTEFSKRVCEEYDGYYLDVLNEIKNNSLIVKEIDTFYPNDFFNWIAQYNEKGKFIIVDNFDFLINTWREQQEEMFLSLVEKEQSNIVYCFIVQERKFLMNRDITNLSGKSRIINLFEIN